MFLPNYYGIQDKQLVGFLQFDWYCLNLHLNFCSTFYLYLVISVMQLFVVPVIWMPGIEGYIICVHRQDMQRRWQMSGKRLQKKQVGMQKKAAEGRSCKFCFQSFSVDFVFSFLYIWSLMRHSLHTQLPTETLVTSARKLCEDTRALKTQWRWSNTFVIYTKQK